jgi:transposase
VLVGGEGLELSREELLALLAARDEALAVRDARTDASLVQVGELTAQVQALVLRLGKDSSTSSKPPSSDGPDRRLRGGSSRKSTGCKPGMQPGAPGQALALVDDPDDRVPIPAPSRCGCDLAGEPVTAVRRRQVHDLASVPDPVVTEYVAEVMDCPRCGEPVAGQFPPGVNAPASYGPEVTAKAAEGRWGTSCPWGGRW